MTAVVARILLRYVVGGLLGLCGLQTDIGQKLANDPDMVLLVAACIAVIVEGFYWVAKKLGWKT